MKTFNSYIPLAGTSKASRTVQTLYPRPRSLVADIFKNMPLSLPACILPHHANEARPSAWGPSPRASAVHHPPTPSLSPTNIVAYIYASRLAVPVPRPGSMP